MTARSRKQHHPQVRRPRCRSHTVNPAALQILCRLRSAILLSRRLRSLLSSPLINCYLAADLLLRHAFLRFAPDVFLDEREHFLHNRSASVASLRASFAFGPECRSRSLRNYRSPSTEC